MTGKAATKPQSDIWQVGAEYNLQPQQVPWKQDWTLLPQPSYAGKQEPASTYH